MTFTVEHKFSESVITLLDDAGSIDDVLVYLNEDHVDLIQIDTKDTYEVFNQVTLSVEMLKELLISLHKPEGMYSSAEK